MPRPRPVPLTVERLENRTTPAVIGLETTDQTVAAAAGSDDTADVAVRPDGGGFVVVYQSPDAGGRGVFAQRYDGNWQPAGGRIAVNTVTANEQILPKVAADAAGNFVVVWQSGGQDPGAPGAPGAPNEAANVYGVYARRFTAAGAAIDAVEFRVNTTTAGQQQEPDVAANAAGQFVVAWRTGTAFNIVSQSYTSITDKLTSVGAIEAVVNNTMFVGQQYAPAVAIDAAGDYLVVYTSFNQDSPGNLDEGVYARRMNAVGTGNGAEFRVNTVVAGNQGHPDVAVDGTGNFTVVWQSDSIPADGSGTAVVLQRYTAAGAARGGNTLVNTTTAQNQTAPRISASSGGGFVVAWASVESSGTGSDVYFQQYDADGIKRGGETAASPTTTGDGAAQAGAAVGMNAAGDFVVAFDAPTGDLALRRFGEAPVVRFAAAGTTAAEAAGTVTIGVTRSAAAYVVANVATAVTLTRTGGTADPGADFTDAFPATVTLAAGATSGGFTLAILDDAVYEGPTAETVVLELSVAGGQAAIGSPGTHTVSITDDEPPPPPPPLSATLDAADNLVITDTDAAGKDNTLTITVSGSNLVVTDAAETFQTPTIGGATLSNGGRTLTVPLASIPGDRIILDTGGGTDTVTADLTGGAFGKIVVVNGGNPAAGTGDRLRVVGGGTQTATYTPSGTAFGGGTVVTSAGTIAFTGFEAVALSGLATAALNLPAGDDVVTLADGTDDTGGASSPALRAGGASGGVAFAPVTFRDNGAVVIDTAAGGTDGADTVTITSATAGGNANLAIDTGGGTDAIDVAGAVTFAGGTVALAAGGTVSGAGAVAADRLTLGYAGNAGTYTLAAAANDAATLSATTTGSVEYRDSAGGLVLAASGVGGTFRLTTAGGLTQTAAVAVGTFALRNTAGDIDLATNGAGNGIGTLAARNLGGGSTSVASTGSLTVGSVAAGAVFPATAGVSTDGPTTITGGAVRFDNDLAAAGPVELGGAVTLAATAAVTATDFTLRPGSSLAVALADGGAAPVRATGAVSLNGATLSVTALSPPPPAAGLSTARVIDAGGAVAGSFAGLPEGGGIVTPGVTRYVTYRGGDGNDIELNSRPVVNGTAAADALVLRQRAGDPTRLEFSLNGGAFVPVEAAPAFTFNGGGGGDTLTVDFANGPAVPAGGVVFVGTPATGTNVLVVKGTGTQAATYAPGAAETGTGVVNVGGAVTFSGVGGVDFNGLATAAINLPGGDDHVTVADGSDAATGLSPALVVSGTSGGSAFAPLHVRNSGTVVVDTAAGGTDGDDAVTVTGATAGGDAGLTIATGTGADAVTFAGTLTLSGTLDVASGGTITVGGGTMTAAAVHLAAGRTIDESGIGAINTSGTLTTESAGGTTLDGANTIAAFHATNTAGGAISLTNTAARLTVTGVTQPGGAVTITTSAELSVAGAITAGGPVDLRFGQGGAGAVAEVLAPVTGTTATLVGGGGADRFAVAASGAAELTLDGAGGGDTYEVAVGGSVGTVAIADTGSAGSDRATLTGTAAADTFEVNTSAAGAARTVAAGGRSVTYTATLEALTLDGAGGDDAYHVGFAAADPLPASVTVADSGTTAGDAATLYGTAGADTFDVNTAAARTVVFVGTGEQVVYTATLETLTVSGPSADSPATAGDTFRVTPDPVTAVVVAAGTQAAGPGDTLVLNAVGLTDPAVTGSPPTPGGTLTASNRAAVTWASIEALPVPLGLGGSFDFGVSAGAADTQAGFLPVTLADYAAHGAYAAAGVGWISPGGGTYNRVVLSGQAADAASPRLAALLRDGAWGHAGGGSNNGRFRVAVAPNQDVQLTVYAGDAGVPRDGMNMYVTAAAGTRTRLNPTAATLDTAGGSYQFVTYSGLFNPGNASAVVVEFEAETAGPGRYWTVSGVDVRPLGFVAPLSIARADDSPGGDAVAADGVTVDAFAGSGAAPFAELTVAPDAGTPTAADGDADPAVAGFQVVADAAGRFAFGVRRPSAGGSSVVSVRDATGAAATGRVGPTAAGPLTVSPNPFTLPNPFVQEYATAPATPAALRADPRAVAESEPEKRGGAGVLARQSELESEDATLVPGVRPLPGPAAEPPLLDGVYVG